MSGRPPGHLGGRGRSSPVFPLTSGNKEFVALKSGNTEFVALKSGNKDHDALKSGENEFVALKSGNKEEDLGHEVIQRFPQEKRRNTFEVGEEQKGKWRRRERSKKPEEEDFDNVEMEGEMKEVGKRTMAVDEKQMMDDVVLLMKKVAEALAEFAMDQSVDNLGRMGLQE